MPLHPETTEVLNAIKRQLALDQRNSSNALEFILTKNFLELNEKLDILIEAIKPKTSKK